MSPALRLDCLIADMRKAIEAAPDLADHAAIADRLRSAGFNPAHIETYAGAVVSIERVRRRVMGHAQEHAA